MAAHDAFPEARSGWTDAMEAGEREPARFTVELAATAAEQAQWLRQEWGKGS